MCWHSHRPIGIRSLANMQFAQTRFSVRPSIRPYYCALAFAVGTLALMLLLSRVMCWHSCVGLLVNLRIGN